MKLTPAHSFSLTTASQRTGSLPGYSTREATHTQRTRDVTIRGLV